MCASCWGKCPPEIQGFVFKTWTPDAASEGHRIAVKEAVKAVEKLAPYDFEHKEKDPP